MRDKSILIDNGVDLEQGLELFGDIEMYNESLGDFMAEINEKLQKIVFYKKESDMPNYAILVHSLKSDAKYFGFTKLAEMAYKHELESKANNVVFVNENHESLEKEAKRIISVITKYLGGTADETENTLMPERPKIQPVTFDSDNITILVVDDSDIIQSFIRKIFADKFNVVLASNGAEAIKIIESNGSISAMLLDLNMPEVNGFKVLEYMKQNNLFKNLPVSIITGNNSKEIDLKAFDYPIIDILKKPFNDISIRNIIERTLGFR